MGCTGRKVELSPRKISHDLIDVDMQLVMQL